MATGYVFSETGIPCPHCHGPFYPGDNAPLVERLRYWHAHDGSEEWGQAADEIERLRKEMVDTFNRLLCSELNQPRAEIAGSLMNVLWP